MKKFLMIVTFLLLGIACAGESIVPAVPYEAEAVLFYPAQDSGQPVGTVCIIPMGNDRARSCIEALFETPFAKNAAPAAPEGARLTLYESTGDIVTIGIETTMPVEDGAAELFSRCVCLTLRENSAAKAVNVLVDGMSAACLMTDGEAAENGVTPYDAFTLYLPALEGSCLTAVCLPAAETDANREEALISALFSGETYSLSRAFPALARPGYLRRTVTEEGRLCLMLDFNGNAFRTLAQGGYQKWQFISSLAMTCVTNLPDLERVIVRFDGEEMASFPSPSGTQIDLPHGAAGRSRFASLLHTGIKLKDGTVLIPAGQARRIESIVSKAVPSAGSSSVNAAVIVGDTAYVDLSSAFASRVTDGRDTVYRMVNALCENLGLQQVRFLIDGQASGSIGGISIVGPLIMNPGS